MSDLDVGTLILWLGPEGAIAGLEKSKLTNADLMRLLREGGFSADKRTGRRQLVIELVMSDVNRIDKSDDELVRLSIDELRRYFAERLASSREIEQLLLRLGIPAPARIRGKVSDFAAREISELGLFQRVAGGRSATSIPRR